MVAQKPRYTFHMHRLFPATLFVLLGAPFFAGAAEFPSRALFLSHTPVTEGETVLIHAVVANDAADAFEGEVRYRTGETSLGVVPVTLDSGEARTVSLSWTPEAGSYTVVAELRSPDETVVASEQARFSIEEKPSAPKPDDQDEKTKTEVESSQNIQQAIAGVSAPVAEHSAPVFAFVDSARERGAQFLDGQIEQTKERLAERAVLGAATGTEESGGSDAFWKILQTIYLYTLTILRQVLSTAIYFYPLLALGFLYFLWRLYRRISTR